MRPELVREQPTAERRTSRLETVDGYLSALREQLVGADPALVQDALASAHEYLRGEQAEAAASGRELSEAQLMARTLERYGTPEEVAEAYRESERTQQRLGPFPAPTPRERSFGERVLGVVVDPRAYGSLFYMFLALATGIVFFTWTVTGLALSIGLLPLIIGVPFALLYLASLRGLAQVEGRIVEGLLGERMPRWAPVSAGRGWWARIKGWLADWRTWTTLAYMILKLPLGVLSFAVFSIILSLTLGLALAPLAHLFTGLPVANFGSWRVDLPWYVAFPVFWLAAAFDLLVGLHLARALGKLQARLAKVMLVRP
jgi:hypothetical protein